MNEEAMIRTEKEAACVPRDKTPIMLHDYLMSDAFG